MPCDTIVTSELNLKDADPEAVRRALASLGLTVEVKVGDAGLKALSFSGLAYGSFIAGKLSVRGSGEAVDRIAREFPAAYAEDVVKTNATRFGWKVEAPTKAAQKQKLW